MGYLVPQTDFVCSVHSVFANACNLSCDESLLTLATPRVGDGPTTLVLRRDPPQGLHALFRVGETVFCRNGAARARRAEFHLGDAHVWRPLAPRALLPPARIRTHLQRVSACLAQRRRTCSSVIDREGAAISASLVLACRALDGDEALRIVDALIGWGEGLTPAGDDFVVGWRAGLDSLAQGDDARKRFLDRLGPALVAASRRTTPIAAHLVRLAALGHCGASLGRLRDALLCEDRADLVTVALEETVKIGATSGTDMVHGLLTGLSAWSPLALAAQ